MHNCIKQLPFSKLPFPNELVTSWVNRIAAIYKGTWDDFRLSSSYPGVVDYGLSKQTIEILSAITCMPAKDISQIDLAARFPKAPLMRFVCHEISRKSAPDFCPACFRDDQCAGNDCYFRHEWAIAGVGHCHIHQRRLLSHCPVCSKETTPYFDIVNQIVGVFCPYCHSNLADSANQREEWTSLELPYALDCEKRLLDDLGGMVTANTAPFFCEPAADIAFLLFHNRLPRGTTLTKTALRGWGTHNLEALTFPIREAGKIFDRHLLFPLATTLPHHRSYLFISAMAAIEQRDITNGGYRDAPRSLDDLFFDYLDDDCREELVCRADRWPGDLRRKIGRIITTPIDVTGYNLGGWAHSAMRRALHEGKVPKYTYL